MNDKVNKVTIFHIFRKDGTSLFLHPFDNPNNFLQNTEKSEIKARYGKEPRVESLTVFRNDLYRMIETSVKNWVSEAKFVSRFIISSVGFLVSYLFLSFVIRDPIPMVDEILISLGVSIALYFFLSRRDRNSSVALQKRADLRAKVDQIVFVEDDLVKEVELILQNFENESREGVIRSMLLSEEGLNIKDEVEARQLIKYLEKRFQLKDLHRHEKMIDKMSETEDAGKGIESLSKWADSKKIDISLFATYRKLKQSCKS